MKNSSTFQEILVFTGTKFSQREWIGKQGMPEKINSTDELKSACWNGLVTDLIPEICEKTYDPSVTLWEVNEADHFLELQYGTMNEKWQVAMTLNPYLCLMHKEYN